MSPHPHCGTYILHTHKQVYICMCLWNREETRRERRLVGNVMKCEHCQIMLLRSYTLKQKYHKKILWTINSLLFKGEIHIVWSWRISFRKMLTKDALCRICLRLGHMHKRIRGWWKCFSCVIIALGFTSIPMF